MLLTLEVEILGKQLDSGIFTSFFIYKRIDRLQRINEERTQK
jgi:hypothetical protein